MRHITLVGVLVYSIFLTSFIASSVNDYSSGNQQEESFTDVSELPKITVHDQVDLLIHDPAIQRDIRGSDLSSDEKNSPQIDAQRHNALSDEDFFANVSVSSQDSSDLGDEDFLTQVNFDNSSDLIRRVTDGYRILINNQPLPWLQAEERYLESRYKDLHILEKTSETDMLLRLNKVSLKMVKRLIEEKRLLASRNKSWIERFVSLTTDLY